MMKFLVALLAICFVFAKIHPEVERELSLKGNHANIFIEFEEKVDFDTTTKNGVKVQDLDELTRGRFVVSELMGAAMVAQQQVKTFLESKGIKFQSFFIQNAIYAENVPKHIIYEIQNNFDNVAEITPNPLVDFELETPIITNTSANGVEWNVKFINADKVWEKGFKGKGILIGNSDTGVQWDNLALKRQYKGNVDGQIKHDFHWFDPSSFGASKVPIDTNGHGTHCMGTKLGEEGNNKIGMAPESQWIACRSLGPGASRNTVVKCLEFFLAPTDVDGNKPSPDKRPHITSHSYLCNGCQLDEPVKALRAAGIAVVVANGNSGPRCGSTTHPASIKDSFSVGALAPNSHGIASFSSRGPVTTYVKPDISAPGQNVRSCTPRGYQVFSGTSMAAPAVAGCYALLWNAVPALKRNLEKTEALLRETAHKQRANGQCNSDAAPNNVFGWGTINCIKAVERGWELYGKP